MNPRTSTKHSFFAFFVKVPREIYSIIEIVLHMLYFGVEKQGIGA